MTVKAKGKAPTQLTFLDKLEKWLVLNKKWVVAALIGSWVAVRISGFVFIVNSPLYYMYRWSESDNRFFDDWAKYLNRDWLNEKPLHHYHSWHHDFAEYYFKKHPEKLQEILAAHPDRDSTFVAGRELWNEWYKGKQYHQEPLYAYTLAVFYFFKMNAITVMLLIQLCLGVLSGILLFFLSGKYFGETAAAVAGILYLFCGVIFVHEITILRTSWIVFCTILNVWLIDRALDRLRIRDFFLCGIGLGFSVLMWSAFSLFFYGTLAIALFLVKKDWIRYLKLAAVILAGFMLMRAPVIIRNVMVGVPAFSSASGVESTFISTNAYGVNSVSGWGPSPERDAEILGETYNSLPRAIIATLKTHPSVWSYVSLLWMKVKAIWQGIEWADNVNYYFYKLQVPFLKFAFVDFFLIAPLGLAGLIFCIHQRKKYFALYLAILVNIAILMAFHVLGRYRTSLVMASIPLAAMALTELARFIAEMKWSGLWKAALIACLLFLSYSNHHFDINTRLRSGDYSALYDNYYLVELEKLQKEGRMDKSVALHRGFLDMQPEFISALKPGSVFKQPNQIAVAQYFAQHHRIHSNILKATGDERGASRELSVAAALDQAVEKSARQMRIK